MGLGADLMRFFAKEHLATTDGKVNGRSMLQFSTEHADVHPHPALNLAAAQRLCEAGRLVQTGTAVASPLFGNHYASLKTTEVLETDLNYGTFDFLVDGLPAVLDRLCTSVFQLVGTSEATGDQVSGTAFLVGHRRLIATAKHCVEGVRDLAIKVQSEEDALMPVSSTPVVQRAGDVAILTLASEVNAQPFQIGQAQQLDRVTTMGYPSLAGLLPTLLASSGEIAGTAANYLDGQHGYLVTTCAVTGGSSGGPVVREDGKVLGVVSAFSRTDKQIDPGRFGLASPIADAAVPLMTLLLALDSPEQVSAIKAWVTSDDNPFFS